LSPERGSCGIRAAGGAGLGVSEITPSPQSAFRETPPSGSAKPAQIPTTAQIAFPPEGGQHKGSLQERPEVQAARKKSEPTPSGPPPPKWGVGGRRNSLGGGVIPLEKRQVPPISQGGPGLLKAQQKGEIPKKRFVVGNLPGGLTGKAENTEGQRPSPKNLTGVHSKCLLRVGSSPQRDSLRKGGYLKVKSKVYLT